MNDNKPPVDGKCKVDAHTTDYIDGGSNAGYLL